MKKLILLLLLICTSNTLFAQRSIKYYEHIDFGVGVSNYIGIDSKNSNDICMSFSCSILNFYIDITSNLVGGKGEYLDFSSNSSYDTDKYGITGLNVGWRINLWNDKLIATPKLGVVTIYDIYNDPILFDTHFHANKRKYFSMGANVAYYITDHIGLSLGCGNKEILNFQFVVRM